MSAPLLAGALSLLGVGLLVARRASATTRDITALDADPAADFAGLLEGAPGADAWYKVENMLRTNPAKLSKDGLERLKRREGLSLTRYRDPPGGSTWSIGYGHLLGAEQAHVRTITQAQADAWLIEDVAGAEAAVNSLVRVALKPYQFDALVSFVYNVGTGAFARSTLRKRVNAGDAGAAEEFARWVYVTAADGTRSVSSALQARRAGEAAQYRGQA